MDWIYLPLAQTHEDQELFDLVHSTHSLPVDPQPRPTHGDEVYFFTDGGGLHPKDPLADLASWSVVQDVRTDTLDSLPKFETIATGLVPNRQYAGRGELCAFVMALRAAHNLPSSFKVHFVTDASYVCRIIDNIRSGFLHVRLHTFANADLLPEVIRLWDDNRFSMIKVKSHRSFESAVNSFDLFLIMGNFFADKAATAALVAAAEVQDMAKSIAQFNLRERKALAEYFAFLVDLNGTQMDLTKNSDVQMHLTSREEGMLMPRDLMGDDAMQFLVNFSPNGYISWRTEEPEANVFQAMQCGANLARAVFHWACSLLWPSEFDAGYRSNDDWGISWLELTEKSVKERYRMYQYLIRRRP
eukprot:Skav215785  [mRNA]  locus=scaffold2935:26457:27947:+ [translate_table: standard]